MKSLKLSFALLIAVLAVGVTVATKAGNRAVTRCFINVTFTDGTTDLVLTQDADCSVATAPNGIPSKQFIKAATLVSSLASGSECPPNTIKYCCVRVTETTDTRASQLNLGEGLKRYFVATPSLNNPLTNVGDIFCKPQQ